jgi:hypothetical protein
MMGRWIIVGKHSVAALFVDPKGVYAQFPDVDCWDEARDARTYDGNLPVVAHPPCQLWGNLAHVNYKRWGGEHNRPGNDGGCFASALASVRRCGGVLEHPAASMAWYAYGLPAPSQIGYWTESIHGGDWATEVWQSAYGHPCQKRTWLYYSGPKPMPMSMDARKGTHQIGWFDRNKPTLGKREASATPLAFACALLDLARRSTPASAR